jgi:hypothetical protein
VVGQNIAVISVAWVLVIVVVGIAACRRFTRPAWLLAGVAGAHCLGLMVMMLIAEGTSEHRYLYPVEMLLFAALTLLLLPAKRFRPVRAAAPLVAFAVLVAVVSAFNYRWYNTYRAQAPRWSDQVARAPAEGVRTVGPRAVLVGCRCAVQPAAGPWSAVRRTVVPMGRRAGVRRSRPARAPVAVQPIDKGDGR